MLDAQTLADRYVAAWNELDATSRLRAIAALWAPGALPRGGACEPRGFRQGSASLSLDRQDRTGAGTAFVSAPPGPPASEATS